MFWWVIELIKIYYSLWNQQFHTLWTPNRKKCIYHSQMLYKYTEREKKNHNNRSTWEWGKWKLATFTSLITGRVKLIQIVFFLRLSKLFRFIFCSQSEGIGARWEHRLTFFRDWFVVAHIYKKCVTLVIKDKLLSSLAHLPSLCLTYWVVVNVVHFFHCSNLSHLVYFVQNLSAHKAKQFFFFHFINMSRYLQSICISNVIFP